MTLAKIENLTVTVRKTVKAPVEKAYKAWTEPEQIVKWFGCDRVTNIRVVQDFRVGGEYRIVGESCQGGGDMAVYGTYEEIVQNKKLVYTWSNESVEFPAQNTVVSVEFIARDDNTTEILLEHTRFASENSKLGHNQGWEQSLEKFANFVAA